MTERISDADHKLDVESDLGPSGAEDGSWTERGGRGGKLPGPLFEEVPCYLTVVDRSYRIVKANRAFRDQFGDIIGRRCFDGYKGLDFRCDLCPVERTFADGGSHESEEVWAVDGKDAHVIVKTAPILDEEGKVTEVLEMALDVTERTRLRSRLEKSREEYKYLFDNVPCYLTVVDRDYTIVQANKLFERDYGERLGENCYRVYKRRDTKCDDCPVKQTFLDGASHTSQHIWFRNGREIHIIATTAPVKNENDEISAVMEMCTDITEVKRLQSELSLLGETIAGMSHNIKNILSGLEGGVYVVDSGLERGREDRVHQGWGMVKRNVEKVSDLVKGILYASKERSPESVAYDPGRLLSEVCELYESRMRSLGVELVRRFESRMGLGLLDPAGIHSVVSNLLSNAVDACRQTRDAGHRITVTGDVEDGTLVIEVSDTGVGMPEDVREKLFSKFYSTKGSRGTGLGLLITRKIVEEHGGTIDVESEPGKGTSFLVKIPFTTPESPGAAGRSA